MNLFAVAIFASAFSGMVAGIKATNGSAWSIATFGSVGLVIGIAGYALTMFPAVIAFKNGSGNGKASFQLIWVETLLMFVGAFASPFVAFYLSRYLLKIALQWFQ